MKKNLLIIVVMFVIATFFIIGDRKGITNEQTNNQQAKENPKEPVKVTTSVTNKDEVKAMYLSYIELQEYIKDKDITTIKNNINTIIDNMANDGFNWLILHVRPFSDSIYPSKIFPASRVVTSSNELPFDILDYFIDKAHEKNIKVHAWINPYRISNQEDYVISKDHPAYQFLNTSHIKIISGKGLYYNPASEEVRNLIISGIKEIVENYDVDGIHFDDYFYPSKDIDNANYEEYVKNGGTMTISEYRLNNVTTLIKDTYTAIKAINKDVLFGIAPEANIDNNYSSNYLDVKKILSTSGYVDYIMPQIYFGFMNQNRPFTTTIEEWNDLIKDQSIELIPALALYKSGNTDKYAGSGSNEWLDKTDILKRQILYARNIPLYKGFSIFRYDFFYNKDKKNQNQEQEVNNIKAII